jgi:hypothetical protein
MIDMMAFAVVAVALAAPRVINLIWGQVDIELPHRDKTA